MPNKQKKEQCYLIPSKEDSKKGKGRLAVDLKQSKSLVFFFYGFYLVSYLENLVKMY